MGIARIHFRARYKLGFSYLVIRFDMQIIVGFFLSAEECCNFCILGLRTEFAPPFLSP